MTNAPMTFQSSDCSQFAAGGWNECAACHLGVLNYRQPTTHLPVGVPPCLARSIVANLEVIRRRGCCVCRWLVFCFRHAGAGGRSPNARVAAALIGTNGRGGQLAKSYLEQTNTEIGYICDVDERVIGRHDDANLQEPGAEAGAESPIFARRSTTRISMCWFAPRRTTGTPPPRSSAARPASTSMSRSRAATTRAKAS